MALVPQERFQAVILDADAAREGVTGHGVRYVLGFSLAASVVALALVLIIGQ